MHSCEVGIQNSPSPDNTTVSDCTTGKDLTKAQMNTSGKSRIVIFICCNTYISSFGGPALFFFNSAILRGFDCVWLTVETRALFQTVACTIWPRFVAKENPEEDPTYAASPPRLRKPTISAMFPLVNLLSSSDDVGDTAACRSIGLGATWEGVGAFV